MSSTLLRPVTDDDVVRCVRAHLHPDTGSPYWLERDRALGVNAYETITGLQDARHLVGLRDDADHARYEEAARRRPIEDFLPQPIRLMRDRLWVSQTGGTTGLPKHGTWCGSYWDDTIAFSDRMLELHGVPRDENWLYIGPMGPHTTGRLVVSIAEHRGGSCFTIDLDPRIVKIFGEEGMQQAYDRYVQHIWDQVAAILESQQVGVLFCTSRLLEMLPSQAALATLRGSLRGIVHAGTTMTPESHELLRESVFPGIPIVGMYGTSTTAISYQKPFEPDDRYSVVYIPSSPHVLLEIVDDDGNQVEANAEGQVKVWRFTADQMIPGFVERDRAVRIAPYGAVAADYPWPWLGDPYSPEFTTYGKVEGVY
jgi:thienamycin biosynthesis protein ThnN